MLGFRLVRGVRLAELAAALDTAIASRREAIEVLTVAARDRDAARKNAKSLTARLEDAMVHNRRLVGERDAARTERAAAIADANATAARADETIARQRADIDRLSAELLEALREIRELTTP